MLWQKIAIGIRYFEEDFKIILFYLGHPCN